MHRAFLAASLGLATLSLPAFAQGNQLKTDIVFIVDASTSMNDEITAVRNGISQFAQACLANNIDAHFALVRLGGMPQLRLGLTADANTLVAALQPGTLGTSGGNEAALEAMRMALGVAPQGFEQAPFQISYRAGALINVILLTDEDSDRAYYDLNSFCAPSGTPCQGLSPNSNGPAHDSWPAWQAEIDAAASAFLARGAYLNMVVNMRPTASNPHGATGATEFQLGSATATALDATGAYDRVATYNNLPANMRASMQGRLLAGGGLARTFNINAMGSDADNDGVDDLVEDLFRIKVQETLQANAAPIFTQGPVASCGAGSTPLPAVVGQPLTIVVQATGPEAGQTTTLSLQPGAPAGVVLDATAGATANGLIRWTPGPGQIGLQVLRVVATDDGLPQRSSTLEVCINVGTPSVSAYCFGTGCPCGNDDATGGCANSSGAGGLLDATGSTSTTSDDLRLVATRLPLGTFGVLYAGTSTTQAPFGDGFRCVQPGPPGSPAGTGFLRFPIRHSGTNGSIQEGPGIAAWSISAPGGFGAILPGSVWHFQAYYRNPTGPCGQGWNLTNALSVTFQ